MAYRKKDFRQVLTLAYRQKKVLQISETPSRYWGSSHCPRTRLASGRMQS